MAVLFGSTCVHELFLSGMKIFKSNLEINSTIKDWKAAFKVLLSTYVRPDIENLAQ
jgi:hypothetical protein